MKLGWDDIIELPCPMCGEFFETTANELETRYGIAGRCCSLPCKIKSRGANWGDWFWNQVDKTSHPNGCWIWKGAVRRNAANEPYGKVNLGQMTGATKVAYYLSTGVATKRKGGLFLCHTCDNSICVNPEHLWIGTAKENVADSINKGRRKAEEQSQ